MYGADWFKLFLSYVVQVLIPIVFFMVFVEEGKDRMAVFDFVSAWVSDIRILSNLELDCMDASLDAGGAHS